LKLTCLSFSIQNSMSYLDLLFLVEQYCGEPAPTAYPFRFATCSHLVDCLQTIHTPLILGHVDIALHQR